MNNYEVTDKENKKFSGFCIDCGKTIKSIYERCFDCYVRYMRVEKGILENFCIDCRQVIPHHRKYLRCYRCNQKYWEEKNYYKSE